MRCKFLLTVNIFSCTKPESPRGDYLLEIYKTDDLLSGNSSPFRRLNADPMEIVAARWVTDNHIFGTAWQVARSRVRRPEDDIRNYTTYSYNLEENRSFLDWKLWYCWNTTDEPDTVLIASGRSNGDSWCRPTLKHLGLVHTIL